MCAQIAIVYNGPVTSRYTAAGEDKAVLGVMEAVKAVHRSLVELEHTVKMVPLVLPIESARRELEQLKTDLVFNLFEGFPGSPETEALIPDILTELGIPFTGCSAASLRLALDKAESKKRMRDAGIATPDYQILNPQTLDQFHLRFPCIVKPRAEDASHGLSPDSIVNNTDALKKQVEAMNRTYGGDSIVEEFIDGQEFNITALGNGEAITLPPSEINYTLPEGVPRLLTFAAKWDKGSIYYENTAVVCPAKISGELEAGISKLALAVFHLIIGHGYARVDVRMDRAGRLNALEVNPNPDITPGSGAARQAKAAGMTYSQFVARLIAMATERKNP